MTDERLLQVQTATITEHMAKENLQDILGTMTTFGNRPDVFFDAVALKTVFTGIRSCCRSRMRSRCIRRRCL